MITVPTRSQTLDPVRELFARDGRAGRAGRARSHRLSTRLAEALRRLLG